MYNRLSGRPTESLERDLEDATFGGMMKEGKYKVTIDSIVWSDHTDYADFSFLTEKGESFRQRIFFYNFDRTDLSYKYKQLIAATASEIQDVWRFHDDPDACADIAGEVVEIVVGNNEGVPYTRVPEGFKAGDLIATTLTELSALVAPRPLRKTEIKEILRVDTTEESEDNSKGRNNSNAPNTSRRRKIPSSLDF